MLNMCKRTVEYAEVAARDHCTFSAPTEVRLIPCANREMVVVFHNIRCTGGHLIMQELCSFVENRNIELTGIRRTTEDYERFTLEL